ncbi:hypothetical protein H2198_007266 [Neophaeococcomyces mojaviensis]|uniref:Uncharacterized protein n=1 Tax=Neophaeococcomyces mojaviensis TaxID=3383035 RepID=A0ACC3A0F7_9EURO|nr:hypothetical protein H2198_007266 [Knufia sp. JES_112]
MPSADPLAALPAELVLRILDFASISTVTSLTQTSRSWNHFIEKSHLDRIYAHPSKTCHPSGSRDLDFVKGLRHFTDYWDEIGSWKELCKRQTLLRKNWQARVPETRESIIQVEETHVWRFRPDFKRRYFVSSSETGGIHVTCMDTGQKLWSTPARQYAHLEYDIDNGVAVWDTLSNALEVWKAKPNKRGHFELVATIRHDQEVRTRGYELRFQTLCVVSDQGRGFVYDMMTEPPSRKREMIIAKGAVGHLFQSEDLVMYSMGYDGVHVHDKVTGGLVGIINPQRSQKVYHINHVKFGLHWSAADEIAPHPDARPQRPSQNRIWSLPVELGENPNYDTALEDEEWGAVAVDGDFMAVTSRFGRLFVCKDWRRLLKGKQEDYDATCTLIECEADPNNFQIGGWLSLYKGKVAIEVDDAIYLLSFEALGSDCPTNVWRITSSLSPRLQEPVSYMAICDDSFMHTYLTNCEHRNDNFGDILGSLPTKVIRVLALAPDLSTEGMGRTGTV